MDLGVNLDSSAASSNVLPVEGVQVPDSQLHNTLVLSSKTSIVPSMPSVHRSERKRRVSRRSSLGRGKNKSRNSLNTTSSAGNEANEPNVTRKRRRKSYTLQHEELHYAGSSLFSKPTSSTRPRHSAMRRYSPSPENRSVSKMKNVVIVSQQKGKQQREKMEFNFSNLPPEYDSTSVVVLKCLKLDAVDFVLNKEFALPIQASTALLGASSHHEIPIKEEVVSVESSDEDEDVPVVRMADIGAAPFTPTPVATLPVSMPTKSRKKCKPSQPVIKLPRRKSLGVATRAAGVEYSLVRPVAAEQQSSILENAILTNSPEQTCSNSGKNNILIYSEDDGVRKEKEEHFTSTGSRPKRNSASRSLDFLAQLTQGARSTSRKESLERGNKSIDSSFCSNQVDVSTLNSSTLDCNVNPLSGNELQTGSSGQEGSECVALPDTQLIHEDSLGIPDDPRSLLDSAQTKTSNGSTSTENVNSTEERDHSAELEEASSGIKTKGCPISVKCHRIEKERVTSVGDSVHFASTSRQSPTLVNVRRSSRGHILTTKLQDFEHQAKTTEPWKPSKRVDPNSALSILRRVSKYTRPPRSPSPQPSTALVCNFHDVKPLADHTMGSLDEDVTEDLKQNDQPEQGDNAAEVSETQKEPFADDTCGEVVDSKTTLKSASHPNERVDSRTWEEVNMSDTANTKSVSGPSSLTQAGRVSGREARAVRPSSRFVNDDFVSPIRSRKLSRSTIIGTEMVSHAAAGIECAENNDSTNSEGVQYSGNHKSDNIKEIDDITTCIVQPGTSKPTAKTVPLHSMETRRRSKGKKTHGVKIRLKIFNFGNFPRVRLVEDISNTKTEEKYSLTREPATERKKKTPAKKYPSPWSRYIPSVKPVLGNIYYSDGTVEKLGVSVNAVMDRLLAEVCQDGITRHSAIINKREKKKRNIEKARERVHRLKEEKAAREAQGYIIVSSKSSRTEQSHQHELGLRARSGKHTLLQKDFHYPSLKRGTKAEMRKNEELRRQRSRKVMSKLAESAREDQERSNLLQYGSTPTSAKYDCQTKPRALSPFNPEKQERLRLEEEQREKQKRLAMPISFNTFLASKTSVLTAQPLLQPQRSNDRAPIPDHFYRELLCEYNSSHEPVEDSWTDFDMDVDDGIDVTTIEAVHIPKLDDYVAPPVLDQSAEAVAIAVEEMLMRPSLYAEEDGISYLHERALEQPELRRSLLLMATECISALHIARLSAVGREAAIVVYNVVTSQASKMRDVICMFSKEREEAVFWMHRYLIEMLPVELLASYLFLLRHTRLLNCQVKSIVRSTQNDSNPWPEITRIVGKYVELSVVEPDAAELDRTIVQASLPDVVFVLVAPNISIGDFSVRDRHYDPVFKWLREIGNPASVLLRVKIDETFSTTISEVFFTAVSMISRVVTKMVREHRQKRVVLVGWGTTCCFNHVVLNSVPGVSAVIDLAYPLLTIDGPRGEPDDDILLTYCPTLFVVGSQACDYHPGFMKMMRSNMIMPSGLVVIGHANSNLLVSCATLSRLRITQRAVSRCVVEQICDFLSMEWTKRERSRLVPVPLNDALKVDLMQLRNDEKAAHASRKPRDDVPYGRKKKLSHTPIQSPLPRETSPSLLPVSQLDSMRSNFQNLLKKAGNEKSLKCPEERLLLLGPFKEPRPPTKAGSTMASPASTRTESPSLLDPASISLA